MDISQNPEKGAARSRTARRAAAEPPPTGYARSLIEASLDPLVTISPEGKITDVNEATVKATGVPREKLIGTDFSDYFTEPEQARAGYQRVFAQGFVTDYPLTIRHHDGSLKDVLYNASVYKDARGKTLGVFAAARDVTAQKQASQYARSLLEASLDPLVTISPQGMITDVNEAAAKATGVPREELIGTDFSDYFTEPEQARAGYRQVFARGFVTDYPLTIRHRNGGLMDLLYNASVYKDARGRVIGVFAAARDITERKAAEQRLQALAEDLKRSNRDLEQFAYVASHDLQEPLRMVASFTQLLEKRYRDKLDRDALEFIGFAVDGATRMQRLVNDLLAYSRVSSRGKDAARVDAHAALGEALVNLGPAIREAGAMVTNDDLPSIWADYGQLVQVFQNLIGNALKFHGPQPPRVHVGARREGPDAVFSVQDNGIGIAPEFFDRIFIIFQRLHGKAEYPGTGIGLALCKRIVERHGGKIWVESQPGQGATFRFRIPAQGG